MKGKKHEGEQKKKVIRHMPMILGYVLIACMFFSFGKWYKEYRIKEKKKKTLKIVGQKKIDPNTGKDYVVKMNKPIVVVIPSYNNEKWCEKNLRSVFEQNYSNYRVIYIDDCSEDNTCQKVKEFIQKEGKKKNVSFISNKERKGALNNLYNTIHSCKDEEIIVTLDGDDWLAHEKVLSCINEFYANPNVWLTYGQYIDYPSFDKGLCSPYYKSRLKRYGIRKHEWISSHLRTFYAGLFKKIKLEDFLYKGKFFEAAWDLSFMMPMLEMAGKNFLFVDEVLYVYNRANPISDGIIKQQLCKKLDNYIRSLSPYPLLKDTFYSREREKEKIADIVIFSYDKPMQLFACLESIKKHVSQVGNISVIFQCSEEKFEKGYEELQKEFPKITWKKQSVISEQDFKFLFLNKALYEKNFADYILFCSDDIVVKDKIFLKKDIKILEQTNSHAFFYSLGKHVNYCYSKDVIQDIPTHVRIGENILAWQYKRGKFDWQYPHNFDMTLYRKKDVKNLLEKLDFSDTKTLKENWGKLVDMKAIGLCHAKSKGVNISLNLKKNLKNKQNNISFTENLLNLWDEGYKIDIDSLYKIKNKSTRIKFQPKMIKR